MSDYTRDAFLADLRQLTSDQRRQVKVRYERWAKILSVSLPTDSDEDEYLWKLRSAVRAAKHKSDDAAIGPAISKLSKYARDHMENTWCTHAEFLETKHEAFTLGFEEGIRYLVELMTDFSDSVEEGSHDE